MGSFVVGLLLFLAIASHSVNFADAVYCLCNSQLSETLLQENIDYACGAGADCAPIHENGVCYNPNTVRDHCNYAVNSYYQRRGQVAGSCVFSNTTFVSANPPNSASGCVYPSSPSNAGGSTTPSTPGTPNTGGGTTIPGTPGTVPGSTLTPGIGLAPSGTGFDSGASLALLSKSTTFILLFFSIALLICGRI